MGTKLVSHTDPLKMNINTNLLKDSVRTAQ